MLAECTGTRYSNMHMKRKGRCMSKCWDLTHDSAQSYVCMFYQYSNSWNMDPGMPICESANGMKPDPCGERDRLTHTHTHTSTVDDCGAPYWEWVKREQGKSERKQNVASVSDDTSLLPSSEVIFNNASATPPCSTILYSLNNAKQNLQLSS